MFVCLCFLSFTTSSTHVLSALYVVIVFRTSDICNVCNKGHESSIEITQTYEMDTLIKCEVF